MGIIEWLTSNIGAIFIFIVVVLAIIIIWKVYLRNRLLKPTNEPEKIENPLIIDKPNVVLFIRPHATCVQCLMLCIENIGTEAAYNVQFGTSNTPFLNTSASNLGYVQFLKKNNFLQKGISCFGPGQRIEQFLIVLNERLPEDLKQPFQISVTYTDSINNPYDHKYPLDFGEFEDLLPTKSIESKAVSDSFPLPQSKQPELSLVDESNSGLGVSQTLKPNSSEPSSHKTEKTQQPIKNEEDNPLSPDLQKLVTFYNANKDSELRKIFDPPSSIHVSNETERLQNPNIPPVFQTKPNGSFDAYAINPDNLYAVVPFSGLVLQNTLYSSGALSEVFECPGFDPKYKYDIKVIRPAFFKRDPINEKWTLEETGKLELTEKDN